MSILVLQSSWRGRYILLLLSCRCIVTINVLHVRLFFTVPWVGLKCVIVVFPDHTHLLFVVGYEKLVNLPRIKVW